MYKLYFKQALQMLKDNKFISIISIAGTALAIMMIMVIIVTEEIKTVDAAPEINRSRTFYIFGETRVKNAGDPKDRWINMGNIKYDAVKYLLDMKTPELVSAMIYNRRKPWAMSEINVEGLTDYYPALIKWVDPNYWKIMSFDMIEGRTFTGEEFESGVKVALIRQSFAGKIFKGEQVLGKYIEHNFGKYKIIGIIKDVSQIFKDADAEIWIPYKSVINWDNGSFEVMLLAKDKNDFAAIKDELKECAKKFDAENEPWKLFIPGPVTIKDADEGGNLGGKDEAEVNAKMKSNHRKMIFTLIILLLVPSLNLSSFSMSRIKKRVAEIGIRKAFGAKRSVILIQVLYENLITSFIGGFIGLVLSIITVIWLKTWLLGISADAGIPVKTYLSWTTLLAVTLICIVLNLLSAGIPAYRASRMSIIDSLNQKR